ncbi:MAG: LruC domain-containing protein [Leptospiraceae bacterium]|nr:LruC domain-containing protein [Leptospiraceae bacterium]
MEPIAGNSRKSKRGALRVALLVTVVLGAASCNSAEDPNLAWLLSLQNGATENTQGSGTVNEIPFSYEISDIQQGDGQFIFDTNKSIPIEVVVQDPTGGVPGTLVQVRDANGNRVLFRAKTDESGNVTGNVTVNQDTRNVVVEVSYNGQLIQINVDIEQVSQSSITLRVQVKAEAQPIVDRDGDGIPDNEDQFPDDPNKATTVRVPSEGYYRIAYEDLYPNRGDADFNDYVVQMYQEQDLNASGQLVELRAHYQHIAKGAGYDHTLHLALPESVHGSATLVRYSPSGEELSRSVENVANGNAIEILGRSNNTISQSNTAKNQSFAPGQMAVFTFLPSAPVALATMGKAPYDLFIKVLNTGHEVHFAGKYYREDGSDRYIDSAGFPWALLVPDYFQWPYERENIHDAYPQFDDWYLSAGKDFRDWYDSPVNQYVFPLN